MSVRNAIAKRDEAAANGAAKLSPAAVIRQTIERQAPAFRAVLPRHVDPERFSRLVLTAVKATPDLMRCFATEQGEMSVLLSAMQAAAIGLEPNTPTQDAWILPRKNKGVWEAQLAIGYRGYQRLARRSGTVKTIFAEVVRAGDHFVYRRGLEADTFEHEVRSREGDELTHAYAVVRFTNGGYNFTVLDRTAIEKRRDMSPSWNSTQRQYSPWETWAEAMWRKSAIRALVPYLDLAPEVEHAIQLDERPLSFDDEAGIIELEAGDEQPDEPEATGVGEEQAANMPEDIPPPTDAGPAPETVTEFKRAVGRRSTAIVAACQQKYPDRELADLDAVFADAEALDHAMSLIEAGR
jgi:recombination protein RecT